MLKKTVSLFTALVLLLGVCVSLLSCTSSGNETKSYNDENNSPGVFLAGGMKVGDTDCSGITLVSETITDSESGENVVALTATVEPAYVLDSSVSWQCSFVNQNSEWASGKSVTDYVSLEVGEDTKVATVTCLQPFGEQIIVSAVSNSNASASADCLFDYAQKVTSASLNIGNLPVNLGGQTDLVFEVAEGVRGPGGVVSVDFTTNDVYTIAESFEVTVDFEGNMMSRSMVKIQLITYPGYSIDPGSTKIGSGKTNVIGQEFYFDYDSDAKNWTRADTGATVFSGYHSSPSSWFSYFVGVGKSSNLYFNAIVTITGEHSVYKASSGCYITGYTNSAATTE